MLRQKGKRRKLLASGVILILFILWCLALIYLKLYTTGWASGFISRPEEPPFSSDKRCDHDGEDDENDDDGTSSTKSSRSNDAGSMGTDASGRLSIDSSIFFQNNDDREELTMAVIAREQKRDESLRRAQRKRPEDFSTTTNGRLTLLTCKDNGNRRGGEGLYRVYVHSSLRLKLLRTYHDCLVNPDDVNNAETMIYEYFTWNNIRRDANEYVRRYRQTMERSSNSALVSYHQHDDDDDPDAPITLDVIAREQKTDTDLVKMMHRAPSVFSTATNGSIQLITARGKDRKYRIVIPRSLQAKVLQTYHDCLVNPTEENNFEKVLYVHFTWNGIHKDVEEYVRNEGLTEEMKGRRRGDDRSRRPSRRRGCDESRTSSSDESPSRARRGPDRGVDAGVPVDESCAGEEESESSGRPIGLDEIAKEQKKDKELRQLKKDEPFVFSTVRYGNTLLTTAQNFRDNKYRIVIPRSLQGRMLLTYRECLLNPTPDRNFETLLYNHFTWNGIHDDVDYFVKSNGRIPKKDDDSDSGTFLPLVSMRHKNDNKHSEKKERKSRPCNDPEYDEWEAENEKFERKIKRIRIAFLLSGLFMVISSILFFEKGVKRVFRSLDDAQGGLQVSIAVQVYLCDASLFDPNCTLSDNERVTFVAITARGKHCQHCAHRNRRLS